MQACFCILFFIAARLPSQEMPHESLRQACQECHQTNEWDIIHFDHSRTEFPLSGKHRGVNCIHCHQLADFSRAQSDCEYCHIDVHQGKLTYACDRCHSDRAWPVFDVYQVHASTSFQILGAHGRLDCEICHQSEIVGQFSGLKSDCYSCHAEIYEQTENPNHRDFGFGVQCENCHAMISWRPATFLDHDARFPISSGAHAGEWQTCRDCHLDPMNFQIFSCINCHAHNQAGTTAEHDEVGGFIYESNACYRCHPTGRGEGD